MRQLRSRGEVDRLLREPLVLLLKHSTACPVSARAHRAVEEFLAEHPDREVHKVHVIEDRSVSNYIAEVTGVVHQSPQLLLLENGQVVWHVSHFGISADRLEAQLAAP